MNQNTHKSAPTWHELESAVSSFSVAFPAHRHFNLVYPFKSMVVSARRLALNPYGDQYPDDNSTKEIWFQADGFSLNIADDRHVLLGSLPAGGGAGVGGEDGGDLGFGLRLGFC